MIQKLSTYYNNLKKYQKVELFLLPIIIFIYLFYLYFEILIPQQANELIQEEQVTTIKEINQTINKTTHSNNLKKLDSLAKRYAINIESIDIKNQSDIDILTYGGFKGLMNFIYEIEKNDKSFKNLTIELCPDSKSLCLKANIIDNKFDSVNFNYKELLRELDKISSPFKPIKTKQDLAHTLKIKAVFNDSILIGKDFIKIGDIHKGYKLISIGDSSVTFVYKDEIVKVDI